MTQTQLARTNAGMTLTPASIESYTLDETMRLGQVLAQSGFFQDSRQAAQCVTKILAGREMGFGPIASMTGIYIVKDRPAVGANLMAAAVKRSGRYDYRVARLDDKVCDLVFFENGQEVGHSTFTFEDATKAGTQNMSKFPRNMLFARAISNGVKFYCPDVFSGAPVYTPEELGARVDGEGSVIREAQPVVPTPQTAPAPQVSPGETANANRSQPGIDAAGVVHCKCGLDAQYRPGPDGKAGGWVCAHYPAAGQCDFRLRDADVPAAPRSSSQAPAQPALPALAAPHMSTQAAPPDYPSAPASVGASVTVLPIDVLSSEILASPGYRSFLNTVEAQRLAWNTVDASRDFEDAVSALWGTRVTIEGMTPEDWNEAALEIGRGTLAWGAQGVVAAQASAGAAT